MTTNEMIRADELLQTIQQSSPGTDTQSPTVQANPYVEIAAAPFPADAAEILLQPIAEADVEIRPDGLIYLPEIKYRRILNRAFGPGAWSLLPMEITVSPQDNMLYYKGALFVYGRFVSEAIGEQQYFPDNERMSYATAAESAKSNCLMRCCKDLGIASELWDPVFIRQWIAQQAVEAWCVNIGSHDRGKKKKMWRKRSAPSIDMYPWREEGNVEAPVVNAYQPSNGYPRAVRGNDEVAPVNGRQPAADRPAERAAERSAAPVAHGQPLISIKQAGRFRAIAKAHGWTIDETERLLDTFGYQKAEDIGRFDYDRICTALEDQTTLSEIRTDLDHESADRGDDVMEKLPF